MAQKFISLEEAAKQLGVSRDRLNDLREAGKVRAYRDGAGWKFRTDDVEKLTAQGLPSLDPSGSDLSLESESEPQPDQPAAAPSSGLDLDLGDGEILPGSIASDVNLEDLDEPTVPVDAPDVDDEMELGGDDDFGDISDSILLSETELGESTNRPPSTIIGKAELAADMDLELASSDSDVAAASDVKIAPSASNVLSSGTRSEAVLDTEPPGLSDNFGGLEELEIDLEAESSRILSPEDVAKAKRAASSKGGAAAKSAEVSDLELAPSDSKVAAGSSGDVLDNIAAGESGGLTGLSALELEGSDPDDQVLGDGSDITLSSESSGINIISPSDSGLALDEVPLELSSAAAMGSSLDLGAPSDAEVDLEPLETEVTEQAKGAEPFTLTPFGEEAADEEEDSSQIIPLDEVSEDEAAGALLGVGGVGADALGDDFATAGLGGGVMAAAEPVTETPFSVAIVACLSCCMLLLVLSGMMMFDLLRNIWSWDQVYRINSALLEVVNPFLS